MIELKTECKGGVFKMYARTGIRRVLGHWAPLLRHSDAIGSPPDLDYHINSWPGHRTRPQSSRVPPPRVPIRRAEGAGRRS